MAYTTKRLGATVGLLGLAAVGAMAMPHAANAGWRGGGIGFVLPSIVVAPPAPTYVAPPTYTYVAPAPGYVVQPPYAYYPAPQHVWVPAHWEGGYWIPAHWA